MKHNVRLKLGFIRMYSYRSSSNEPNSLISGGFRIRSVLWKGARTPADPEEDLRQEEV